MYNRITAMLLVFLMAGAMAACASDDTVIQDTADSTKEVTTDAGTEAVSPIVELGGRDFNGEIYTVIDGNDYQDLYQNVPADSTNGDTVNDALYNRDKYMEDTYHCEIENLVMTRDEAVGQTRKAVMSGEANCNLLITSFSGGLDTLSVSGILANIAGFDDIELDAPWWSALMNEQLMLDGRLYVTSGDVTLTMYSTPSCVFLNSKLLEDYKINKDYYSIVSDGLWTWDELKTITASYDQDLNSDNQMNATDDFFGLAYLKNNIATCAIITGSGVHLSTLENDTIKLDLANERLVSVIDKMDTLLHPINYVEQKECMYTFMEDRAIALIHSASSGREWFRDMDSDYMILPIPKLDTAQKTYYSYANTYTPAYIGIPLTASGETTDFITEAMARYSYEFIRPEFYNLTLKQKGARDDRSGEMLDLIYETAYLDFNSIFDFGGTRTKLKSVLFEGAELASAIASAQAAADDAVAQFIESWTKDLE